jgi:hypothetical protein
VAISLISGCRRWGSGGDAGAAGVGETLNSISGLREAEREPDARVASPDTRLASIGVAMGTGAEGISPEARFAGAETRPTGALDRALGASPDGVVGNTVVPGFDRRAGSGFVTTVGASGP